MKKNKAILVRFSETELNEVRERASVLSLTVSEYIRLLTATPIKRKYESKVQH